MQLDVRNPLETSLEFSPMPYEVDFTGFLSNTVVVRWMERLRVTMMSRHLREIETAAPGNLSVIRRTEIDYIRPVRFGDRVIGKVWVQSLQRCRWDVSFSFLSAGNGVISIRATQTGAFISPESLRPIAVPARIVAVCSGVACDEV